MAEMCVPAASQMVTVREGGRGMTVWNSGHVSPLRDLGRNKISVRQTEGTNVGCSESGRRRRPRVAQIPPRA